MIQKNMLAVSLILLYTANVSGGDLDPVRPVQVAPPVEAKPVASELASPKLPEIPTTESQRTPVDPQLLQDLARIRRQMGGSVLDGSLLKADDTERTFENNLESLLSQPTADLPPAKSHLSWPEHAQDSPSAHREFQPDAVRPFDQPRVVAALRHQSEKLERIANQLERIREYQPADELRASAKTIRELARSLDRPDVANDFPGDLP